jgi:hypothetical protein
MQLPGTLLDELTPAGSPVEILRVVVISLKLVVI